MNSTMLERLAAEFQETLPPGARVRDVSGGMNDPDLFVVDIVSEYSRDLVPPPPAGYPMLSNILRTTGSFSGGGEDELRRGVARLVEKHNEEWAFIHSAGYAEALGKAKAE